MPAKRNKSALVCANKKCKTAQTPLWRKGWKKRGPEDDQPGSRGAYVMLCNSCGLHFKKNHYCYWCLQIYKEKDASDSENPWISSLQGSRWIHISCEKQNNPNFEAELQENGGSFFCKDCLALKESLNDEKLFKQTFSEVKKRRKTPSMSTAAAAMAASSSNSSSSMDDSDDDYEEDSPGNRNEPSPPAVPSTSSSSNSSEQSSNSVTPLHTLAAIGQSLAPLKIRIASSPKAAAVPVTGSEKESYEVLCKKLARLPSPEVKSSTPYSASSPTTQKLFDLGNELGSFSLNSPSSPTSAKLLSPKKRILKSVKMRAASPAPSNTSDDCEHGSAPKSKLECLLAVCANELQKM